MVTNIGFFIESKNKKRDTKNDNKTEKLVNKYAPLLPIKRQNK